MIADFIRDSYQNKKTLLSALRGFADNGTLEPIQAVISEYLEVIEGKILDFPVETLTTVEGSQAMAVLLSERKTFDALDDLFNGRIDKDVRKAKVQNELSDNDPYE